MEQNVVCRTCLRQTKKYVSIFSAPELWGKNIVLAKLIMACAPVVIKIGDGLPTKICDNCLQLLQLSFLFRLRVITANEKYKEIIRTQVCPRLQVVNDIFQQTENLNQIYSTEYIFESINDSAPSSSRIVDAVKQEPLDIKEELENKSSENSPSKTTLETTALLNKNNLHNVVQNQQETQTNQREKIIYSKKKTPCQEKIQSINKFNNINENKIYNKSKTTNSNGQSNEVHDISINCLPTAENSRLAENSAQNIIIGNEEQIDNELNLKLINNKQRIKRTYSKIGSSKKSNNNSLSKIPKLQSNIKITFPIELIPDEETERKFDVTQTLQNSESTKTNTSNFIINNDECIIIDD